MSKKIPHCSPAVESEHDQPPNHCQVDRSANTAPGSRNKTESGQRNGDAASSSPESGSLNGDVKRSGKSRRRKKRSSNPDSRSEGKLDSKTKTEENANKKTSQPPDPHAVLIGLQAECANVWFEHSIYERAESLYQCWLASSSNGTSNPNQSPPGPQKQPNSPSTVAPSSSGLTCHHSDQVACHHVVQAVWVNKSTFDQAEHRFVEESTQPSIPNSLDLPSPPNRAIAPRTPDEGYQSLAPTPATPVIQQAAVTPTNRQSINGLPHFPVELLRDVWLEKPLYDRAEAAFYQNLYGNNSSKWSSCASTSRRSDHPQCLVEEEEEEQDEEGMVVEEKRVVQQGKAEVFHALHPIQEEEEPTEVLQKEDKSGRGVCYFLHLDSERVWLDKWRYDAAESNFHGYSGDRTAVVKKSRRPEADASSVASNASLRDKYDQTDQTARMEQLQMFHFIFHCFSLCRHALPFWLMFFIVHLVFSFFFWFIHSFVVPFGPFLISQNIVCMNHCCVLPTVLLSFLLNSCVGIWGLSVGRIDKRIYTILKMRNLRFYS